MTALKQDFEMFAGDSKQIIVSNTNDNGSPLDLTGASVKWSLSDIVKTNVNGIYISNPINGEFVIHLDPEDTVNKIGKFRHEAVVTDVVGNVSTVLKGYVTIRS